MKNAEVVLMTIKADVEPVGAPRLSYARVLVSLCLDMTTTEAYHLLMMGRTLRVRDFEICSFEKEAEGIILTESPLLIRGNLDGTWAVSMP